MDIISGYMMEIYIQLGFVYYFLRPATPHNELCSECFFFLLHIVSCGTVD